MTDMNVTRLQVNRDLVYRGLHGCDLDGLAVKTTRARLFLSLASHASRPGAAGLMLGPPVKGIEQQDFLLIPTGPRHDIVIGNPPYLMEVRSNQEIFRQYSKAPGTARYYGQKIDIFYLFMFKGLDALNVGGILAFIVQEYWMDRFHAKRLRERVFLEATSTDLVFFKNFTIFPAAPGHHSMITVIRNAPPGDNAVTSIARVNEGHVATSIVLSGLLSGDAGHLETWRVPSRDIYDRVRDKVFAGGQGEAARFKKILSIPHVNE